MATQGNGARVLGPWPNKSATALRENAPQGPFLIPQGDRNFNYGCGALFTHAEIREDMIYDIILNTLTGQLSQTLNRALDIIYHGIGRKTGF